MPKLRVSYNAPVVLTFAIAAVLVQVVTGGPSPWFASWPELEGVASYLGLISHILGHASWEHLLGNFMMILLLGPILEERHGSRSLLLMIVITALITGVVNLVVFNDAIVGASGIVFMMILLASTANIRAGEIPLTFVAVSVLFLGQEIYQALGKDEISQMADIVGGLAGAAYGFVTAPASKARSPRAPLPAVLPSRP